MRSASAAAVLAGYDWGGRAACIVAALWPERVRGLVTCTGYNIQDIAASAKPASAEQEHRYWYQYYFHTERGRAGLTENRRDICAAAVEAVVAELELRRRDLRAQRRVVRQSGFRRRRDPLLPASLRLCAGRSGARGDRAPSLRGSRRSPCRPSPCMARHDGVGPVPEHGRPARNSSPDPIERRVLPRIGHNVPQEAPAATVAALRDLMKGTSK